MNGARVMRAGALIRVQAAAGDHRGRKAGGA